LILYNLSFCYVSVWSNENNNLNYVGCLVVDDAVLGYAELKWQLYCAELFEILNVSV
jgi:hypothetical protein